MSRHLPGDALQLVACCGQFVAGVPGVVQSHHGLAHRPIASLSAAHEIPPVVSTTGTTTLAVRAAAIDGGIAMTSTYLKGVRDSCRLMGNTMNFLAERVKSTFFFLYTLRAALTTCGQQMTLHDS